MYKQLFLKNRKFRKNRNNYVAKLVETTVDEKEQ